MAEMRLRPADIKVDRARRVMAVRWNDGHLSEFPFADLREACPCAECREGSAQPALSAGGDLMTIPLARVKSYDVLDVQPVGNYALLITWGDGHKYGIYTWDFLRGRCPCEECRATREGARA